jgi:hypothetical protein
MTFVTCNLQRIPNSTLFQIPQKKLFQISPSKTLFQIPQKQLFQTLPQKPYCKPTKKPYVSLKKTVFHTPKNPYQNPGLVPVMLGSGPVPNPGTGSRDVRFGPGSKSRDWFP